MMRLLVCFYYPKIPEKYNEDAGIRPTCQEEDILLLNQSANRYLFPILFASSKTS